VRARLHAVYQDATDELVVERTHGTDGTELRSRPMGKRHDTLVFIPAGNELITAEVSRRRRK
jgi:hypothetical protein